MVFSQENGNIICSFPSRLSHTNKHCALFFRKESCQYVNDGNCYPVVDMMWLITFRLDVESIDFVKMRVI